MSEAQTEGLDNLYDDLYDCATVLIHHFRGMLRDMESETYTPERAEQDWTALTYNEGYDILAILAEIVATKASEQ